MSARSKFHALLKAANFGDSVREAVVAEILGEHAHELAEKIRDHPVPPDLETRYLGAEANAYLDGGLAAADLIDPEVE